MSKPIVLSTVAEVDEWAAQETTPIAAVLTMGALHQGHAELVRYAKANTPNGTRMAQLVMY
jgi:pantothenate synthetase